MPGPMLMGRRSCRPAPMGRGVCMFLRLEPRAELSKSMLVLSPLIAVGLTLLGGLILFATLGKNPIEGFTVYFFYPLRDLYGWSELLLKATPLMLIGVGLSIGFRASVWN